MKMNRYDETATETKSFGESPTYRDKNKRICDNRAQFKQPLTMSGEENNMNFHVVSESTERVIDEQMNASTLEGTKDRARILATLCVENVDAVVSNMLDTDIADENRAKAISQLVDTLPSIMVADVVNIFSDSSRQNDIYVVSIVTDIFATTDEVGYEFCDENFGKDFV